MSDGFAKLPPGAQVQPTPYQVSIADDKVDELKQLVKLGRVGPPTYESTQHEHNYGVSHQWLTDAKAAWIDFDCILIPSITGLYPSRTKRVILRSTSRVYFPLSPMLSPW
ncbi:hypothetical protein LB505_005878 [Fusarium chuoi]|nr:hypothetical protein LB505_005878 [Fusarium chuoi]